MNHQISKASLIKCNLKLQGYDYYCKSDSRTVILQGVDAQQPQRQCLLIHCSTTSKETKILSQLFATCSLTLQSAQHDAIDQALKKQKTLIWYFGGLDKLTSKTPLRAKTSSDTLIQHYRIGEVGSIMICIPAVAKWMNCATTKRKIWEEFSSIF